MAKNHFFADKPANEQNLYEDLIIESLKIYGQEVYYMPREIVNEDKIFGEDVPSKFSTAYKIEMYIENQQGFDGEGDLFTKFGIEIRDAATFIVSRRRWRHTIQQNNNTISSVRPREGDVLYLPLSNSMFEIMHVEHEMPFYQLNNVPTYNLRCELFVYSDEDLDTGIEIIDGIENDAANVTIILDSARDQNGVLKSDALSDEGGVDFWVGETVYQIDSSLRSITGKHPRILGEVIEYRPDIKTLTLGHISVDSALDSTGTGVTGLIGFTVGKKIINNRVTDQHIFPFNAFYGRNVDSNAFLYDRVRTILSIDDDTGYISSQNDTFDANNQTGTLVDFLDFSEGNPFGDAEDN
jgi:hypothetical protein|tara:strand:- start:881 stop:1939 length:1059 start_codon:yes stop_codon:yes gene_type:complete